MIKLRMLLFSGVFFVTLVGDSCQMIAGNGVRPDASRRERAEIQKLQGDWDYVAMEANGKRCDIRSIAFVITIRGDEILGVYDKTKPSGKIIRVMPTMSPKAIDFGGPEGNVRYKAIYDLEGDQLRIAVTWGDFLDRPKTLTTKEGNDPKILVGIFHPKKK